MGKDVCQPLAGWRNETMRLPIFVIGADLTGKSVRAQLRQAPGTPGNPLLDLPTVSTPGATGIRLVSVDILNGVLTSTLEWVIARQAMQGIPAVGDFGTPTRLSYALQIDGVTRLWGDFFVLDSPIDSDTNTADRAPTGTATGTATSTAITLTMGGDGVTLHIDGTDLVGLEVAKSVAAASAAGTARDQAQAFAEAFAGTDVASAYATYADAANDVGAIPANGYVLVFADEMQLGQRSLYQKVGGALQYRSVLGDALPLIERRTALQPRGVGVSSGLWMIGSDSLSAGAAGSTVRTTLNALGRANLGYGGPGYLSFDDDGATDYATPNSGVDWYHAGGTNTIAIADGIYGPYSLDGRGQYCRGGDGSGNFGFTPRGAWKRARVYYLKGIAGSFKWRFGGTAEATATTITTTAGGLDLGYFDVDGSVQGGSGLLFSNMTGDVAIFGADFIWEEAGYRPANVSRGGRWLQDVAAQDSAFRRKWFAELKPVRYPINAGMNDRLVRTAAQHYSDLTAIITDVQAAAPDCGITIIQSLDPADALTSFFSAYTAQKLRVADERKVGFLDLRRHFGRYADAVASGLMADPIHPDAVANQMIGQVLARQLGLAIGRDDPGIPGWSGGGSTAEKMWRGDLPLVAGVAVTAGQRKRLLTLGLINPYPVALLKLDIVANLSQTGAQTAKHVEMGLTNGTTPNNAKIDVPGSLPTVTQTYTQAAGNGATIDFTVDVTIVNDRAEIGVTANQNCSVTCEGSIRFSALYVAGQSYFIDVG